MTRDITMVIYEGVRMTTISKSKLKARMLQIFREIERSGEELIVTDHGRPVLRIQAIAEKRGVGEVFGALQGQVIYHEDVNTPTLDEWGEA
jgi:antitoxin (DNA-binding transcriptional repressor) of toxin-antitoxin stability system